MITIVPMEKIPAGSWPFDHDPFNMGSRAGKNVMVMQGNHTSEECGYLVVVNMITGERVRLEFEEVK